MPNREMMSAAENISVQLSGYAITPIALRVDKLKPDVDVGPALQKLEDRNGPVQCRVDSGAFDSRMQGHRIVDKPNDPASSKRSQIVEQRERDHSTFAQAMGFPPPLACTAGNPIA